MEGILESLSNISFVIFIFLYIYICFIEEEDLPESKNNFRGFGQSAAGRTAKSTRKYMN
jgi:hypothetical protein